MRERFCNTSGTSKQNGLPVQVMPKSTPTMRSGLESSIGAKFHKITKAFYTSQLRILEQAIIGQTKDRTQCSSAEDMMHLISVKRAETGLMMTKATG